MNDTITYLKANFIKIGKKTDYKYQFLGIVLYFSLLYLCMCKNVSYASRQASHKQRAIIPIASSASFKSRMVRFFCEHNKTLFIIDFVDMQMLKENIKQRILAVAREEFIAHGVRDTSIRTVARRAGIAVGNVYNYFNSKDELFCEVLRPLLVALDRYILSHNEERHLSIDVFNIKGFQSEYIGTMKTLVEDFRPELRLLLFNAEGTSLAGYKERITEHQTKVGIEYLLLMKERYPHIDIEISPFFLHIVSSTWVTIFTELVEHEDYDDREIERALEQYAAYSMAGWKELMKP